MAEEGGFEPPRALTPLSVFETDPFSRTWVLLRMVGCQRNYSENMIFRQLSFLFFRIINKSHRTHL